MMEKDKTWHSRLKELVGENPNEPAIEEFGNQVDIMVSAGFDSDLDKRMQLYQAAIIFFVSKTAADNMSREQAAELVAAQMLYYFNNPAKAVCDIMADLMLIVIGDSE